MITFFPFNNYKLKPKCPTYHKYGDRCHPRHSVNPDCWSIRSDDNDDVGTRWLKLDNWRVVVVEAGQLAGRGGVVPGREARYRVLC